MARDAWRTVVDDLLADVRPQAIGSNQERAVDAVAIRDARGDVDAFLKRHGDPFERIGLDARSTLQFYLGSSGVPETFVVDGKGIIRYQHIGYIGPQDIDLILQKLREAES